jgi:hypothetical protein
VLEAGTNQTRPKTESSLRRHCLDGTSVAAGRDIMTPTIRPRTQRPERPGAVNARGDRERQRVASER